jgi:hypothetical protein
MTDHGIARRRRWPIVVACFAMLTSSCVGPGKSRLITIDATGTCDRMDRALAELAVIWGVTAFFRIDQLVEPGPAETRVAVLHVGETVRLEASASILGPADCTHLLTGVAWGTSDPRVATAETTGRVAGQLTARAPGEITLTADATFAGGRFRIPYLFSQGPYRLRAIRVVAN